jgi:AcrR family transcriptional regulator
MQKHTSRQLQAQKTKKKIYNAAVDLFNKHGFDNTTIEDISRKAGVSVGAFYHYYISKADIYSELYKKIDEYYENTVAAQMVEENFYDNILIFFKHYAAYNAARGTDAVKQLFNTENSLFLEKSRYMFSLLRKVLQIGKDKNQFTENLTIEEAEELLMVSARGVVYHWMLHNGDFDMEAKMEDTLLKLKPIFIA